MGPPLVGGPFRFRPSRAFNCRWNNPKLVPLYDGEIHHPLKLIASAISSCTVNFAKFLSQMERIMAVARVSELISASTKSFEDAVQVGVSRAVETLKNVEGVWVANQKCVVKDGKVVEYRVNLKVTYILT